VFALHVRERGKKKNALFFTKRKYRTKINLLDLFVYIYKINALYCTERKLNALYFTEH